jgi:hypothetical protein
MNTSKHVLTGVNCLVALLVTWTGLIGARTQVEEHPLLALCLAIVSIVFPVLIVTRISWRAGFEAARQGLSEVNGHGKSVGADTDAFRAGDPP